MDRSSAIVHAIDDCIRCNVLKDFLERNASEVRNMVFSKWDWDVAKQVWQEEAREDGMEEGIAIGETRVLALLKKGLSLAEIEKRLGYKAGKRAEAPRST